MDILGKKATNTRAHTMDNGSKRLIVRVENAVAVGKLTGVAISSASDGAPIVREAPVRRRFGARFGARFDARAPSDMVRVRV